VVVREKNMIAESSLNNTAPALFFGFMPVPASGTATFFINIAGECLRG